jgi:hypothetical protein
MSIAVAIAMFGWIPLTLALFAALPARRAVIASYLGGMLLLPIYSYKMQGVPDYGKETAASMILLPCVLLFDLKTLSRFRPRLLDLPMLVFCTVPLFSSLQNNLGIYDGLSAVVRESIYWGVPYLMGRLYLTEPSAHRDLCVGILIGAIVYVPLCLVEIRFSPQLHRDVYGYHQHQFVQEIRYGGYRPVVFMEHGLAVALYLSCACLISLWFWATGAVKRIMGIPIEFVIAMLGVTFVLCKSVGPIFELAMGAGALFVARALRLRFAILLLAAVPLVYIGDRLTGSTLGYQVLGVTQSVSADRASSLEVRLTNEAVLVERALEQPLVGWGGWGRSRMHDEEGNDTSVTDGLWVIILGIHGLIGLAALVGFQILPATSLVRRVRPGALGSPDAAAPIVLAVVVLIVAIDALPNAPSAPVYTMMVGGLTSLAAAARQASRAASRSPSRRQPARPLVDDGVTGVTPVRAALD